MLAVFEQIQPPERSWLKRTINRIFPPAPVGILEVVESIPYIKITCEARHNGLPWHRIGEISLDCSGRMLLPKDIFPPEGDRVKRFVPEEFPQKMLEKLALDALEKAAVEPSDVRLALCGNSIEIQRLLPLYINFAGEIRIISSEAEQLCDFVDGTTELTGASIMLTDDIRVADPCNLIIAPSGLPKEFAGNNNAVIFAKNRCACAGTQIMSADVDIPKWLAPVYSQCYDKIEFLSAFYEISRARRLEDLNPQKAVGRNGCISREQLITVLQGVLGGKETATV